MALKGDTLYVADRKNHLIRALDLKDRRSRPWPAPASRARTAARGGPALKVGLNSPWDLLLHGNRLFIAMAGHHQIWTLDLAKNELAPVRRQRPREHRGRPAARRACFAQPSGLASDGKTLYVADSEVSADPRRAAGRQGRGEHDRRRGRGLFEFGDVDGVGDKVRLQHALGVAYHDGKLYVADTYNSKIKVIDPAKHSCKTFLGGEPDGWLAGPLFNEPGGSELRRRQALRRRHQRPPHPRGRSEDEEGVHAEAARRGGPEEARPLSGGS